MLYIAGLAAIVLIAFVAYLVAAVFLAKLIFLLFAGVAAALYVGIFLALSQAFGPDGFVGAALGSLALGTALLFLIGKAYQSAEAEKKRVAEQARIEAAAELARAEAERARAAEQARAEATALRMQAEAEKAAKKKAGCPCGSGRPFEDCHGMTIRSAAENVVLPSLKKGWQSIVTTINNKL